MKFKFLGKSGNTFGQFAVTVGDQLYFGEYGSNPRLVKINGAQLALDGIIDLAYSFHSGMVYREPIIKDLLVILRMSYDAVFESANDVNGEEK